MNVIYIATMETQNFTFTGIGTWDGQAVDAIVSACNVHARQYQIPRNWYLEFFPHITIQKLDIGSGYRDGMELTKGLIL